MYEIFGMKQGEREVDSHRFLAGAPVGEKMTLAYYFWCIRGLDKTILLETGMADEDLQTRNLKDVTHPEVLLDRIGVNPTDIKMIIVSHLHADHFSAYGLYPEASFCIQRKEVEFFATISPQHKDFKADRRVAAMVKLNYAGRVRFVDGDEEVVPGIRVVLVGGHTPGSQFVAVETAKGTAVLCADAADLFRNIDENIPSGIAEDKSQCLQIFEKIRRTATSPDLIVAGHDPLVMKKFPCVAKGVVKIC